MTTVIYENLPTTGSGVVIPKRTGLSVLAVIVLIGGIIGGLVLLFVVLTRSPGGGGTLTAAAAQRRPLEGCLAGCYSYRGVAPGQALSCERDCKRQYMEREPVDHTRPPLIAPGEARARFAALTLDARLPVLFIFSPARIGGKDGADLAAVVTSSPQLLFAVNAQRPFVPLPGGVSILGPLAGTDYYAVPLPVETLQTMQGGDRIEVAVEIDAAAARLVHLGSFTHHNLAPMANPGPYSCARMVTDACRD